MIVALERRAFVGIAALCFIASAAVTVRWCGSMSSMPGMEMPGGWTMSMAWMRMPGQGWPGAAASFLGMWTVMMVAMMLPTLVPMLPRHRGLSSLLVAGGYYTAWLLLGAALFPAGAALADVAMRNAAVARHAPAATGLVLIIAGAWQSSAWKSRELENCRTRGTCCAGMDLDSARAWRLGFALGLRCMRCCAPWTASLLVIGVMDLSAMALVTAAVSLERLLPRGERLARWAGIAMLASGVLFLTNT